MLSADGMGWSLTLKGFVNLVGVPQPGRVTISLVSGSSQCNGRIGVRLRNILEALGGNRVFIPQCGVACLYAVVTRLSS
jgi:hypothetical protein